MQQVLLNGPRVSAPYERHPYTRGTLFYTRCMCCCEHAPLGGALRGLSICHYNAVQCGRVFSLGSTASYCPQLKGAHTRSTLFVRRFGRPAWGENRRLAADVHAVRSVPPTPAVDGDQFAADVRSSRTRSILAGSTNPNGGYRIRRVSSPMSATVRARGSGRWPPGLGASNATSSGERTNHRSVGGEPTPLAARSLVSLRRDRSRSYNCRWSCDPLSLCSGALCRHIGTTSSDVRRRQRTTSQRARARAVIRPVGQPIGVRLLSAHKTRDETQSVMFSGSLQKCESHNYVMPRDVTDTYAKRLMITTVAEFARHGNGMMTDDRQSSVGISRSGRWQRTSN